MKTARSFASMIPYLQNRIDYYINIVMENYLFKMKNQDNTFSELQNIDNITELIGKITNHNDIDWCWVDIDFLIEFKKKREADDNDEIIDEYKLYNLFKPLERWIK